MGIRGRLILLVAGVFLAMLAISIFDAYRAWESNSRQLKDSLKKRTELAAVAFEQWATNQQEPLATLAEIIEDKPIRSIIIESNLQYLIETRPNWINLRIVDAQGTTLLNSSRGQEIPQSLIDDLLIKLQEKKIWTFTTDRTLNNEHPVFSIARPLKEGGAIIAQIEGETVKNLFNDIELAESSVVLVFDKDGKLLYRRISAEVSFSSEIGGTSLIESLGDERIKTAEIESPFDGISRVYGLARTQNTENIIVIGISDQIFYEPLRQQIYRQLQIGLLIFMIALGVSLFLGYRILKPISNLKEAADNFAIGNRGFKADEKTGGELGELGKAFNQMADQINQREDRLKELDSMKSEFVSSVSHELKTPLTTIKTLTHVLRENKADDSEKNEYLDIIASECDRQILLVSNILDISQIESGKNLYQLEKVNLKKVLQDVYQSEKATAELKNNRLELDNTLDSLFVKANQQALQRVFRSLVENAVKYTPEGGKINVSTETSANEIIVRISDTGCGILPDDLPKIFNKFYRGRPNSDKTESPNQAGGVGLGLYVTKKIVEQLGGQISAENNQTGGANLTVKLEIWKDSAEFTEH